MGKVDGRRSESECGEECESLRFWRNRHCEFGGLARRLMSSMNEGFKSIPQLNMDPTPSSPLFGRGPAGENRCSLLVRDARTGGQSRVWRWLPANLELSSGAGDGQGAGGPGANFVEGMDGLLARVAFKAPKACFWGW